MNEHDTVPALESWRPPKYKCEAPIIGGLGVELTVGSRGRAPGQGVKGVIKLKHFWFLDVH